MTAGERWSDRYAGAGGDAAGGYRDLGLFDRLNSL
jgi:hypothetical protein